MAVSKAKSGKGTLLKIGNGATPTEAFTTILEVRNIGGPTRSNSFDDVTHMESPGNTTEFIPLLIDGGEVSCEGNYLPGEADQDVLETAFNNQTKSNYEIHYVNAAKKHTFAAYVSRHEVTSPHNGRRAVSFGLKITGLVSLAALP